MVVIENIAQNNNMDTLKSILCSKIKHKLNTKCKI